MLHKIFAFALLGTVVAFGVQAQETETELDKSADNINVIPIAERLKIKRSVDRDIDMTVDHARKGELSDILKNTSQIKQKAARHSGQKEPPSAAVDASDKKAAKEYLKKDLKLYNYPRM